MTTLLCNTARSRVVLVDSARPQTYAGGQKSKGRRGPDRACNAGPQVSSNNIWSAFPADNLQLSDKVAPRRLP